MKLSVSTLDTISEMICGAHGVTFNPNFKWENFPYRSSSKLTEFFAKCNLPYPHDSGSNRKSWFLNILRKLNDNPSQKPDLPPKKIVMIILYIFFIQESKFL